jgi:hypothetical protein
MRIIRSAAHGPLMRPAPGRPIMPKLQFLAPTVWIVPILLAVAIGCGAQAPVPEPVTDQETELGQEMYKQLKAKGEIVETSPLYDALRPMADSISRVAQTRYPHPFKFFIVHEAQRLRHARRQRLRRGLFALLRKEHRAIGGNAMP